MLKEMCLGILKVFYHLKGFKLAFFLRHLCQGKTTVLMFHRVSDGKAIGLPTISIRSENYKELINLMRKYFNIISQDYLVSSLEDSRERKVPLPSNPMLLTFDDAYEEIYRHALPQLIEFTLPATIFPVINALEKKAVFWWDAVYAFLTHANYKTPVSIVFYSAITKPLHTDFEAILTLPKPARRERILAFVEKMKTLSYEAREVIADHLAKSYNHYLCQRHGPIAQSMGLKALLELEGHGFTIGSHTVTHKFFDSSTRQEITYELKQSKFDLEKMAGKSIVSLAYPAGIYSKEVIQLAKDANYALGFTTVEGVNCAKTNQFELRRVNVWDDFVCNNKGSFSAPLTLWRLLTA